MVRKGHTNIILLGDSYKVSHHLLYPPATTTLHSYFESRGGKFDQTVFFGLQYVLKKWLEGVVLTQEMIDEAAALFEAHILAPPTVFNREGWEYILREHGGHLPLRIKAVPEGTVLPTRNVLFTVENTDPKVAWLVSFMETVLVQTWYPMTVATNSFYHRLKIDEYLMKTCGNCEKAPFMLHDFGYRACSSVESAGIGGAAHLVNFMGTDTLAALVTLRDYYGEPLAGFSAVAAEHSTMTTWGREGEKEAVRNMLEKVGHGPISVVSDSYDMYNLTEHIVGEELKDKVTARHGCLIVRPDSGDPPTVVLRSLQMLGDKFGTTTNSLGYKQLPDCVRVLQGDGVCLEMLEKIFETITEDGWAADNIGFGSGGALLQKLDRDTLKCAYKCSMAVINGKQVDVFKDPVTDPGKKSKRGRLALIKRDGEYQTVQVDQPPADDELVVVFENGVLRQDWSLKEVRHRASQGLHKS